MNLAATAGRDLFSIGGHRNEAGTGVLLLLGGELFLNQPMGDFLINTSLKPFI
jgi:hypothetical protein